MAISNLHQWQGTQQEYAALRFALLQQLESSEAAPYYDTAATRHPTIGIGFNLDDRDVRVNVFDAMGIPEAQRAALAAVIADRSILNDPNPNAMLQSRLATVLGRPFVMTDTQIEAVFAVEAARREDAIVESSGVERLSYEMLALLSAQYGGVYGPGLKRALQNDDRAEAWYELRYGWVNTGTASNQAFAKRRFAEAALFGLYDADGLSSEEAAQMFQMLQLHRTRIESYERDYGSAIAAANADLAAAGDGFDEVRVQALALEFENARAMFTADLAARHQLPASLLNTIAATNIYLDPGRDSTTQSLNPNHPYTLNSTRRIAVV